LLPDAGFSRGDEIAGETPVAARDAIARTIQFVICALGLSRRAASSSFAQAAR